MIDVHLKAGSTKCLLMLQMTFFIILTFLRNNVNVNGYKETPLAKKIRTNAFYTQKQYFLLNNLVFVRKSWNDILNELNNIWF